MSLKQETGKWINTSCGECGQLLVYWSGTGYKDPHKATKNIRCEHHG